VAVGTIVALTGFGPEHWFAAAFRVVEIPQAGLVWPSWVDIRAVIVSIGVAIVVQRQPLRQYHDVLRSGWAIPGKRQYAWQYYDLLRFNRTVSG
jgi:hypothetical protein